MPDVESNALYPLSDLVDRADFLMGDLLPRDLVDSLFAGLYFTSAEAHFGADNLALRLRLAFEGELVLSPLGVTDLALVLGAGSPGWTTLEAEIVLGPNGSVSFRSVPLTLRVPREVLRDVATDGPAQLTFHASLTVNSDGSLSVQTDASVLSLPECEVAGSGVDIQLTGLSWNFTPGGTVSAAQAAGIEGEFIGFAFQSASITLPPDIQNAPRIALDYCCIGTGGFTGGVRATPPTPWNCQVAGFEIDISRVAMRFQQSRLVMGEIEAILKNLPFFDADVAADVQLSHSGLRIALSTAADRQTGRNAGVAGGLLKLSKPNIVSMTITAAEIIVTTAGGSLRLSGNIQPEFQIPGLGRLPGVDIKALTISSNGHVAIDGGWINLPKSARVSLGGFGLELTRAGLGSEPNGAHWFGVSGTLSLAEGVPITATVDGLKIRWDQNGLIGIELSGIALSFQVEGVLSFSGAIHYDNHTRRFDGQGQIQLVALQLSVGARVVIGRRNDYSYFYIYLLLQSPVGVPLFTTGLAFYGFEALYGHHLEPNKSPQELWFRDWYLRPEVGAVDARKWIDHQGSQAFGAGILLATAFDAGYSLSTKGLLILVLPGPILLLDLKANFLRDPSAISRPNAQALFSALAVFDGRNGTLQIGIQPHYVFPDGGELIDISGVAEGFFSFSDPGAWYIYLGRREREKRIRATLLEIFQANAYLMLDARSFELGGFVGYDASLEAGPVVLALKSYMEGFARVSWRPKQIKGELQMQGGVRFSVAGIGFGLNFGAIVAAQAPQPFDVMAALMLHVGLPWPIPDLDIKAKLEWQSPGPARITAPLQALGIEQLASHASWKLDDQSEPVVPLDGRISLLFERGVNDRAGEGGGRLDATATVADDLVVGDYRLQANLEALLLEINQHGVWQPYTDASGQSVPIQGLWQKEGDSTKNNRRLLLDVRTPFAWSRNLTPGSLAQVIEADGTTACDPVVDTRTVTFDGHRNQEFDSMTPFVYEGITWSLGLNGGEILERKTATADLPVNGTLPRPPYRCLRLPDLGFGTVPTNPVIPSPGLQTVPNVPLRITLSADHRGVALLALSTGNWSMQALDASGNSVTNANSVYPLQPSTAYVPTTLKLVGQGIRTVDVRCDSRMLVLMIALQIAPIGPETIAHHDALTSMLERFKSEEPLLRPNLRYRLTVKTSVRDLNGNSLENAQVEGPVGAGRHETYTFNQQFLFQTQGPPGDADLSPLGVNADAKAGLDTLVPYISRTLPSGGAPVAYRNYDLGIDFNADYIETMYRLNGQTLEIALHSDLGEDFAVTNSLGHGSEIVLEQEERAWLELLGSNACKITLPPETIIRNTVVRSQHAQALAQRRRYDMVLRGRPTGRNEANSPLYQTSFISSAYLNFADHFKLTGRLRSRTIAQLTFADWQQTIALGLAAGDPWAATGDERTRRQKIEVEAFDNLFSHLDGEAALPETVELYALASGNSVWGMLLESPEPFDWERIVFNAGYTPSLVGPAVGAVTTDTVPSVGPGGITVSSAVVTLRINRNLDLSGWRLECSAAIPNTKKRILREFCFPKGSVYTAGTRIPVKATAAPAARSSFSSRLSRILEALGLRRRDDLRVVLRDPAGQTVDLPNVAAPSPIVFRAVRDADGNRAILSVVTSSGAAQLGFGDYTLTATFRRNAGPELPVLSERGSSQDETATLSWTLPVTP
jgi:hypothetical protein